MHKSLALALCGFFAMSYGTAPVLSATTEPTIKTAYLYVAESGPLEGKGAVAQFKIAANGRPTPLLPAAVTMDTPYSIAVDPLSRFLFTINSNRAASIRQFTIGSNGSITPNATPTITYGKSAPYYGGTIVILPKGGCAVVIEGRSRSISSYLIDAAGSLTPTATSGAGALIASDPRETAIEPTGQHVYVSNGISGTISAYTISPTNCVLMPESTPTTVVAKRRLPYSLVISPNGANLYGVDRYGGDRYSGEVDRSPMGVLQFPILTDGVLGKNMSGVLSGTGADSGAYQIVIHPSGKFAYVSNYRDGDISTFSIDSTAGTLKHIANSAKTIFHPGLAEMGSGPAEMGIDPSGKYLYVVNSTMSASNDDSPDYSFVCTIAGFIIGTDGALTFNGAVNLGKNMRPVGIAFAQR